MQSWLCHADWRSPTDFPRSFAWLGPQYIFAAQHGNNTAKLCKTQCLPEDFRRIPRNWLRTRWTQCTALRSWIHGLRRLIRFYCDQMPWVEWVGDFPSRMGNLCYGCDAISKASKAAREELAQRHKKRTWDLLWSPCARLCWHLIASSRHASPYHCIALFNTMIIHDCTIMQIWETA